MGMTGFAARQRQANGTAVSVSTRNRLTARPFIRRMHGDPLSARQPTAPTQGHNFAGYAVYVKEDDSELVEEESGAAVQGVGAVQMALAAGPETVVQRQADVPPPPIIFPHFSEWYFDVVEDMNELWYRTCKGDGLERGFYVMWNRDTKKAFAGPTALGTNKEIELGPVPRDTPSVFPIARFHTHPPLMKGWRRVQGKGTGPSAVDEKTAADLEQPGVVRDYLSWQNAVCDKAGDFFYGPPRRPAKF